MRGIPHARNGNGRAAAWRAVACVASLLAAVVVCHMAQGAVVAVAAKKSKDWAAVDWDDVEAGWAHGDEEEELVTEDEMLAREMDRRKEIEPDLTGCVWGVAAESHALVRFAWHRCPARVSCAATHHCPAPHTPLPTAHCTPPQAVRPAGVRPAVQVQRWAHHAVRHACEQQPDDRAGVDG